MFVFENLRETTTNLIGRWDLGRLYHATTTDEMLFTDQSKIMTAVSATLCGSGLGTFAGFFLTVCIHFLSCLFCACDGPLWVHSCGWGLLNDDLCGSRELIAIPSNIAIYFGRFVDEKKSSNAQAKYAVWRSRNWPLCFHTTVSSASDAPANHPKGCSKRYKQSPIMKGTSTHSSMNPGLLLSIHTHCVCPHKSYTITPFAAMHRQFTASGKPLCLTRGRGLYSGRLIHQHLKTYRAAYIPKITVGTTRSL